MFYGKRRYTISSVDKCDFVKRLKPCNRYLSIYPIFFSLKKSEILSMFYLFRHVVHSLHNKRTTPTVQCWSFWLRVTFFYFVCCFYKFAIKCTIGKKKHTQ